MCRPYLQCCTLGNAPATTVMPFLVFTAGGERAMPMPGLLTMRAQKCVLACAACTAQGERWAYVLAAAASLGTWAWLEELGASLIVRSNGAAFVGLGLLTWRAYVA